MSVESKQCRQCGETKPLDEFYRHPAMGDGHLNHCKVCKRAYQAERHAEIMADPVLAEREMERHRKKALRQYHERKKHDPLYWKRHTRTATEWRRSNQRKAGAHSAAIRAHPETPTGMVRHHWSYDPEHWTDVIFIRPDMHYAIHRLLFYDAASQCFRTTRGHLLDTKRKHVRWMLAVLNERSRYMGAA